MEFEKEGAFKTPSKFRLNFCAGSHHGLQVVAFFTGQDRNLLDASNGFATAYPFFASCHTDQHYDTDKQESTFHE